MRTGPPQGPPQDGDDSLNLPAPRNLRPRALSELLDVGLTLYRDNFLHFIGVAALVNLPLGLVTALLTTAVFNGTVFSAADLLTEAGSVRPEAIAAAALGAVALALLAAAASLFSTAALLYAVHARLAGLKAGVLDAYRNSLRRVPALLGAYVLLSLAFLGMFLPGAILIGVAAFLFGQGGGAVVGGVVLVLIGITLVFAGIGFSILFYIRWWFFKQAAVLESHGPVSALGRSANLVRDRWWKTLGFAILLTLLTSALRLTPDAITSVPIAIFSGLEGQPSFLLTLINSAVSTLTAILILPLSAIATTMLYFDHRVRGEALDLEAGVADLEQQGARI